MTHEEKIGYMRIAAGMACFGFKNEDLDMLVSLYDLVLDKKGKTSVEDVVEVQIEVKERAIQAEVERKKQTK